MRSLRVNVLFVYSQALGRIFLTKQGILDVFLQRIARSGDGAILKKSFATFCDILFSKIAVQR